MANAQTTYKDESSVLLGSHVLFLSSQRPNWSADQLARFKNYPNMTITQKQAVVNEIKAAFLALSWVDAGALDDGKLSEENTSKKRERQNVPDKTTVTDQTTKYSAKLYEFLHPEVEPIIFPLSEQINLPGTSQTQTFTLQEGFVFGKNYRIPFKNADGSKPTFGLATGSIDTTLVENEDYTISLGDDGYCYLSVIDSATVSTNAQTVSLDVTFIPQAERVVGTGGKTDIPYCCVMVVNTNEKGKTRRWIIPKGSSVKGMELAFKKYNNEDPEVAVDIEINGEIDLDLPVGFQLRFRIDGVA